MWHTAPTPQQKLAPAQSSPTVEPPALKTLNARDEFRPTPRDRLLDMLLDIFRDCDRDRDRDKDLDWFLDKDRDMARDELRPLAF